MAGLDRVALLNKLLALDAPFAQNYFADASRGVAQAIADSANGEAELDLASFAKTMLAIYDSNAKVEVLHFGDGHFDPLFAFPAIMDAINRLKGASRAIIVIVGLQEALERKMGRGANKAKNEYRENIAILEDWIGRLEENGNCAEIEFFII